MSERLGGSFGRRCVRALLLIPLIVSATPAYAQAAPSPDSHIQLPPLLTDPATADKLARAMQSISQAFLNLPVGDVQAALEGRTPGAADHRVTVRTLGRRDDPDFDRHFQQQIASVGPMLQRNMKTLDEALPQVMQGLEQAKDALDRAAANMPDPNYPKR